MTGVGFSELASDGGSANASAMPNSSEADPRFHDFILLQAQNAGLFLGQIPNPTTGEKVLNLRAAKSVIESLEMLKNKTAGNLTDAEEKLLESALKNLVPLYESSLPASND